MSFRIRRIGALLMLAAGMLVRGEDFGPVSIELIPPMHQISLPGFYRVHDFRLHNKSMNPVRIDLRLHVEGWGHHAVQVLVERTVLVPSGAQTQTSLFYPVPTYFLGSVRLDVFINGKKVKHWFNLNSGHRDEGILISPSLPYLDYQALKLLSSYFIPTSITLSQWGRHLRDYIGFKRIYLSSEDRPPPEVMNAIMQWVRLGGNLVYCIPPDREWPEGIPAAEAGGHVKAVDWGRIIYCRPILAEHQEKVNEFIRSTKERNRSSNESVPDTGPGVKFLKLHMVEGVSYKAVELIPGMTKIPYRLIFGVMLVFALLIGPVNFWILRRRKKEPWILVTTPVISVVFCILVIVFITFEEGWYSRGRALAVTLLDQPEQRAVTRAWGAIYAPIVPRGGLKFPMDDCVAFEENGSGIVLNLTSSQHFSSGLVRPRITFGYTVSRVETRHERLQVRSLEDGQLRLVNGLGGTLRELAVVGPDGRIFQARQPVEAGASVLIPFSGKRSWVKTAAPPGEIRRPEPGNTNVLDSAVKLPAGYYMAMAEAPLFFTPGTIPDEFKVEQYIIGRYEISGEDKNGN